MWVKASRKLIVEIMEIARRELCGVGMRKRTGEIYTSELNEETLGLVGLNRAV